MQKLFSLIILGALCQVSAVVGGKIAPDGKTEIQVDLPGNLHRANVTSRGQGCCTHTSVHHAALWQNVPALQEFPKWVQDKGLPGGTYPDLMAQRIKAMCKERGVPEPAYIQVEGGKEVVELVKAALASGRMPCVTYSLSPTGRYGGKRISHMVNASHGDEKTFAILDNNYTGEKAYEWLTPDEFFRTFTGGRAGWALILLDAGPPPLPYN